MLTHVQPSSVSVSSASKDGRVASTSNNSQLHNQMESQLTTTTTTTMTNAVKRLSATSPTATTTTTTSTIPSMSITYKTPQPSAVPMKLFAAWEVEKTPANCIPRLCSLTINKLTLNRKFATEVGSLTIAAKIVSSKRTLRSNEINLAHYLQQQNTQQPSPLSQQHDGHQSLPAPGQSGRFTSHQSPSSSQQKQQQSPVNSSGNTWVTLDESTVSTNVSSNVTCDANCDTKSTHSMEDWISIDLHLTFALQYPHFLKKDGNQLQVLLQRRKRYKNRAILGFKTLAVGCLNLNEVLQRCNQMNKQLDLFENSKGLKRDTIVASIIMTSLKSSPIDTPDVSSGSHRVRNITNTSGTMVGIVSSVAPSSFGFKRENVKNFNSSNEHNSNSTVLQLNDSAELDSEDEIMAEDYSISDASDSEIVIGTVAGALMSSRVSCDNPIDLQVHNSIDDESTVSPSKSHRNISSSRIGPPGIKWRRSFGGTKKHTSGIFNPRHSLSQRNLKQKFMSLLKKFKITDSETSDSEEPGASESKAKSKSKKETCKSSKMDESTLGNVEDLEFEFDDSDIDSNSDFGDISITSTPRPGLKPFFSSKSTLAQDTASITLQP